MKTVECSFFITNCFFYILECKWNKKAGHLVTKIFSFVPLITRSVGGFRQFEKVNKEAIS